MADESEPTYIVRAGSDGEALVTAPSGRMAFMGLWQYFLFVFRTLRETRGKAKFEVQE